MAFFLVLAAAATRGGVLEEARNVMQARDAAAIVDRLRAAHRTGVTRPRAWRVAQLRQLVIPMRLIKAA